MASSSSPACQMKYAAFVCLMLISGFKGVTVEPNTLSQNDSSPQVALFTYPELQTNYEVFVSFRGSDIRSGFLSHLTKEFSQKQIVAFVDDKLEKGDNLRALLRAVETSLISLVIFSHDYASSIWCLEELLKIVECREKHGQILLPVFYKVDPTDVRHQKGTYAEAFAKHEKKYGDIRVKIWRDALKESANLFGFHSSTFRSDAELLEEIIKRVSFKLNQIRQVNCKVLVGIDKQITHVEALLRKESKHVRLLGIWGMGGIGKTTLAEEVFNRLCSEYQGCCFLANVREDSVRHGIISLKNKLFSRLLREEDLKIDTPNILPGYVRKRVGRMKVLIVLDDVSYSEQLETLVGRRDLFGSGSRIIVTTRDKQILAKEADDIYQVRALSNDEALQLFSLNAFKQNHLEKEKEYSERSKRVVSYAKGVPLVLKVLGQLLYEKGEEIWESQLEKLRRSPAKVFEVMKLSYDDLDREEQQIVLDIACFFDGLNLKVDYIKSLLKDHDHSVASSLERLRDEALVIISEENIVSMHDIIQEMAWEIVHRESNGNPEKQSRLWNPDDVYQMLKNNKGTEAIRSINVDLSAVKKMDLSPDVFAKMSSLKFLDLYGKDYQDRLNLPNGLHSLPADLRYFRWVHYPLKSLPKKFSAEKLVILELPYSQVEKLWEGLQNLVNLKVVKLDYSPHLMELPDFSKATNLEVMDLSFCDGLTRVHPSLFFLHKLEKPSLAYSGIEKLPRSMKHLTGLRYLDLSNCRELRTLPELPSSIERLDVDGCTALKRVVFPSTLFEQLKENRKSVVFWNCMELDQHSLSAIELNARINLMKYAYQHFSSLMIRDNIGFCFEDCDVEYYREDYVYDAKATYGNPRSRVEEWMAYRVAQEEYYHKAYDAKAIYVYPGSRVPEWMEYRTTQDYITIDLSREPYSLELGFIFCFIVPQVPSEGLSLKLNISVGEGEGDTNSISIDVDRPQYGITSEHVCLIYDQPCSRYLNRRAKYQPRFKIRVSAVSLTGTLHHTPVLLKEIGVSTIHVFEYLNFIESVGQVERDEL